MVEIYKNKSNMFVNEKKLYEIIESEPLDWLRSQMMLYTITRYDYISFIHGSGKDFLGTDSYVPFMEDKFDLVTCEVLEMTNLYKGECNRLR